MTSKHPIDCQAIDYWPRFGDYPCISNNGKYFKYSFSYGSNHETILVIARTDLSWKLQFTGADYMTGIFSDDNKQFIFKTRDTLCFLNLDSKKLKKISPIGSIKQSNSNKGLWLAAFLNNGSKQLIVYNIATGREQRFHSVQDYYFDESGTFLIVICQQTENSKIKSTLKCISLLDYAYLDIWENTSSKPDQITGITICSAGSQLAFLIKPDEHNALMEYTLSFYELWYFKVGMKKAILKAGIGSKGIPNGTFIFNSLPTFSKDGNIIYFQLYRPDTLKTTHSAIMVDIWNYRDTLLQSTQFAQKSHSSYSAAISVNDHVVIPITQDNERITAYSENASAVVVSNSSAGDKFWLNRPNANWLVHLSDGTRKPLPSGNKQFIFSPDAKFLLYYDYLDYTYYNYDIVTGKSVNICPNIEPGQLAFRSEYYRDEPDSLPRPPVGLAAWEQNDTALYVYDNYDIWKLDPSGNCPAINITKGYGRSNYIKFRFTDGMTNSNTSVIVKANESILLTAFNTENKQNGFYKMQLNVRTDPQLLTMGPFVFYLAAHNLLPYNAQNFNTGIGMPPVKAKNADVWIVKRQSTKEAPNYYVTRDFKTYKQLTYFQPQKAYNWLVAELISWKLQDGRYSQGILYKPENFDPVKKYPVIFNYYQQRSHRLFQFPTPEYTIDNIDVAWFVSKGYLVFTPDIYFEYGQAGKSALNTMLPAFHQLSQLPFVDSTKTAINGHSIGGGLTNYLITHTDKFAAAVECAGVSDLISASLQLGGTYSELSRLEAMEAYLGKRSIWEDPNKYIQASPIMRADKVATPLLIMHNKMDGGVPWAQGLELFLALRRLEKPVWMLQYDNGNHSLWGKKREAIDFTIRVTQFFDHYLKNAPAPQWMTRGIPAKLKGIETGYELDTEK